MHLYVQSMSISGSYGYVRCTNVLGGNITSCMCLRYKQCIMNHCSSYMGREYNFLSFKSQIRLKTICTCIYVLYNMHIWRYSRMNVCMTIMIHRICCLSTHTSFAYYGIWSIQLVLLNYSLMPDIINICYIIFWI